MAGRCAGRRCIALLVRYLTISIGSWINRTRFGYLLATMRGGWDTADLFQSTLPTIRAPSVPSWEAYAAP
jgi:hypothetical protein